MNKAHSQMIEALYLELYSKLIVYARSNLDSDALAEEAVQETFRIACQKVEALCASPNPQGWLIQTLKNVIRNTQRSCDASRRLIERYMALRGGMDAVTWDTLPLSTLYGRIAESRDFQLLSRMFLDKMSYKELADDLGISVDACKKRVERAKKNLQKILKIHVT